MTIRISTAGGVVEVPFVIIGLGTSEGYEDAVREEKGYEAFASPLEVLGSIKVLTEADSSAEAVDAVLASSTPIEVVAEETSAVNTEKRTCRCGVSGRMATTAALPISVPHAGGGVPKTIGIT